MRGIFAYPLRYESIHMEEGRQEGREEQKMCESWLTTIFKRFVQYVAFLKHLLFTLWFSKYYTIDYRKG